MTDSLLNPVKSSCLHLLRLSAPPQFREFPELCLASHSLALQTGNSPKAVSWGIVGLTSWSCFSQGHCP